MFSEILKIIPKLDGAGLSSLESGLNKRFASVAKKFGHGMIEALKGGGIVALGAALVDKVLNPLKEVQESIEKTLNTSEDLVSGAKQFNTTAGNLAKLQALGKANGLDAEGLKLLLIKFQSAQANALLNPSQPSAVKQYANIPDTVDAFSEFVQAMQKLTPIQKNLVEQEIFGERQIGRASEFINNKAFGSQLLALSPSVDPTANIKTKDQLAKGRNFERAKLELRQAGELPKGLNASAIEALAKRDEFEAAREKSRIENFQGLQRLQTDADKLIFRIEKAFDTFGPKIAPALEGIGTILDHLGAGAKTLEKSRALRGLVPGQGKDK